MKRQRKPRSLWRKGDQRMIARWHRLFQQSPDLLSQPMSWVAIDLGIANNTLVDLLRRHPELLDDSADKPAARTSHWTIAYLVCPVCKSTMRLDDDPSPGCNPDWRCPVCEHIVLDRVYRIVVPTRKVTS